jgi:hypothetical protein
MEARQMMNIRRRLERLERQQPNEGRSSFEQAIARYQHLVSWLQERGYADALAAIEAGERGPVGLEDVLREQASYDPGRRAFARIQSALNSGKLPDIVDMQTVSSR